VITEREAQLSHSGVRLPVYVHAYCASARNKLASLQLDRLHGDFTNSHIQIDASAVSEIGYRIVLASYLPYDV